MNFFVIFSPNPFWHRFRSQSSCWLTCGSSVLKRAKFRRKKPTKRDVIKSMSHGSRTWSQRRLTQVWTEGFKRKWRALKAEPQGNKKRMLNKCASLTAGGELLRGKSPRSKSAAVLYKQEKLRAVTCIPPCLHSSWLPMPSFSHTHLPFKLEGLSSCFQPTMHLDN